MLWSTRNLMEVNIQAEDDEVGPCKDFLIDDTDWCVRYMVADTHKWLPGRRVLISPIALGTPDWELKHIPVKMTRAEIEASPPLEANAPVSRRYERQYFNYFGWPPYWVGPAAWGAVPYPYLAFDMQQTVQPQDKEDPEKCHLRSVKELTGYSIQAEDEDVGDLHECVVDVPSWSIRYLVVDISKWYQPKGRKILIIPDCIKDIDWADRQIHINVAREDIKNCPEYDAEAPLDRDFEIVLHDYYGWPRYWENVNR
ncbi:MAG: PRC-barrel domain containing protein [Deltaproteobacteria bacterium]|nr:PRC-barrel domain containing protein [Deltaproteobacteria bacterium]